MVTESEVPLLMSEASDTGQALDELDQRLGGASQDDVKGILRDAIAAMGRASRLQRKYIDTRPLSTPEEMNHGRKLGPGFFEVFGAASELHQRAEQIIARCYEILGWPMTEAQRELLRDRTP